MLTCLHTHASPSSYARSQPAGALADLRGESGGPDPLSFHLKNWMDPFFIYSLLLVFSFPALLLNISAASPFSWGGASIGFTSYFYVVPGDILLACAPKSAPPWAVCVMKPDGRPRDVMSPHWLKVSYPGGVNRVSLVTHMPG